jgi:hypothetical protein
MIESLSNVSPPCIIVFNSTKCTAEDQYELLKKLPEAHEFGDGSSQFIINSETVRYDRQQTDTYLDPELRIKTRKRCSLASLVASHFGIGAMRRPIEPLEVLACFLSVPDWQAKDLDVERFFLKIDPSKQIGPSIGKYSFDFSSFALSMYEDLVMSFDAIKDTVVNSKLKCHLKIVPLGIGPSIKSRFGDFLGPYIIPVYLIVLQFACNACLTSDWVHTVEFVDHSKGYMTPTLDLKGVRILSCISRDAFDFAGLVQDVLPAILLPCDSFCSLTSKTTSRNLVSTLANNSNLRSIDFLQSAFKAWPFK